MDRKSLGLRLTVCEQFRDCRVSLGAAHPSSWERICFRKR